MSSSPRHSKLSPLEEALIRDEDEAAQLARKLPVEALIPVLTKYTLAIHPYETRVRVLECLEGHRSPEILPLLVPYLEARPENEGLRAQAASMLSDLDCSSIANEILHILSSDLGHLLEIAPAILGLGDTEKNQHRMVLERFRQDLESLLEITDDALRQLDGSSG